MFFATLTTEPVPFLGLISQKLCSDTCRIKYIPKKAKLFWVSISFCLSHSRALCSCCSRKKSVEAKTNMYLLEEIWLYPSLELFSILPKRKKKQENCQLFFSKHFLILNSCFLDGIFQEILVHNILQNATKCNIVLISTIRFDGKISMHVI